MHQEEEEEVLLVLMILQNYNIKEVGTAVSQWLS